jgi:hypothetical protein
VLGAIAYLIIQDSHSLVAALVLIAGAILNAVAFGAPTEFTSEFKVRYAVIAVAYVATLGIAAVFLVRAMA